MRDQDQDQVQVQTLVKEEIHDEPVFTNHTGIKEEEQDPDFNVQTEIKDENEDPDFSDELVIKEESREDPGFLIQTGNQDENQDPDFNEQFVIKDENQEDTDFNAQDHFNIVIKEEDHQEPDFTEQGWSQEQSQDQDQGQQSPEPAGPAGPQKSCRASVKERRRRCTRRGSYTTRRSATLTQLTAPAWQALTDDDILELRSIAPRAAVLTSFENSDADAGSSGSDTST
ncbi:hypothetical protein JOB18_023393 [Solea senegalensis]|uniref:Uncharacterized protein n=1 Tax=Solea senegalensis TaxID=28829 RepID=A0AAV6QWI9_SOLSE|nr:hypothetical protein JOB18_023393 [Solea senegalensis]